MPKISVAHERARRAQIMDAAAGCFAQAGFAATSVPDIAAAAGLSVGSIYNYFTSKEGLFLAVVSERAAVYNEAVFDALDASGDAVSRLGAALRGLQRLLLARPPDEARLLLELWSRAHDVSELREWLRKARKRRLEAFRRVIDAGKLTGQVRREVRTVDAVAVLMALSDGLVVLRACAPFYGSGGHPLPEAERLLSTWRADSPSVGQ